MKYIIAIDDTDNLESIGTGELAEKLGQYLEEKQCGKASRVTRHQLFFNDAIPYTSHNSAMCFELTNVKKDITHISELCGAFLEAHMALGSDPGLCILNPESLKGQQLLIAFGKKAKNQVVEKEEAYQLAKELNIHLSEHGGTGIGVIGALAGAGLRLYGNDGRYKGQYGIGINQDHMIVKDILTHQDIDSVEDKDGYMLLDDEVVYVTDRVKTVRKNGQAVLIVEKIKSGDTEIWKNVHKKDLKSY